MFLFAMYRALWSSNSFIKCVALFRTLSEFAEATWIWTIPFAHWRNVYDEQATWPVTNAL